MTKRKPTPAITETISEAISTPIKGFVPRPRYREIVATTIQPEDGYAPLTATIRDDLCVAQMDVIPLGTQDTYQALWETIAPYVTAWNATAIDVATGEPRPVPAPAEAGADAFRWVPKEVGVWLGTELKGLRPVRSAAESDVA